MIRRLLLIFAALTILLVAGLLALGIALRPPVLAAAPQTATAFENVTVVNPRQGRQPAMTIRVRDGRIESIEPARAGTAPARFVVPGLIDMHVHHPGRVDAADRLLFALLFLAHGVTSVRDTGTFDDSTLELRNATASGAMAGPRIFACGPILDGDPPWWPGTTALRDAAQARAVVNELADRGVDCIKAYFLLAPDELDALQAVADERHLPLIGHVSLHVPFEHARISDVQHLTGVPAAGPLTRRSDFFRWWADSWRSVDDARIDFVARVSAEQKLAHTPTLIVWKQLARAFAGASNDAAVELLPGFWRDVIWNREAMPLTRDEAQAIGDVIPKMEATVRRLHAAGVRLHAGTDALNPFVVPGASLHDELRSFIAAGLSPEDAWDAATRAAGTSLGLPGLGTVAVGAPADFLVLRDDPTADLSALSTLETVVSQGRVYPKAVLDAAIERHRAFALTAPYRATSTVLARLMMWWIERGMAKDLEIH